MFFEEHSVNGYLNEEKRKEEKKGMQIVITIFYDGCED